MKRLSAASGLLVFVVAGAFGAAALAQEAPVYKWVDPQGVPSYSDQPPPESAAKEIPIYYRKTDRGALQARVKAKSELDAAADVRKGQGANANAADVREGADANAAAEADRQKVLAEREATCQQAKDRVAKYSIAHKLYKPGADGERVYLTSEELDVERADANKAVDQWCTEK